MYSALETFYILEANILKYRILANFLKYCILIDWERFNLKNRFFTQLFVSFDVFRHITSYCRPIEINCCTVTVVAYDDREQEIWTFHVHLPMQVALKMQLVNGRPWRVYNGADVSIPLFIVKIWQYIACCGSVNCEFSLVRLFKELIEEMIGD